MSISCGENELDEDTGTGLNGGIVPGSDILSDRAPDGFSVTTDIAEVTVQQVMKALNGPAVIYTNDDAMKVARAVGVEVFKFGGMIYHTEATTL